MASLLLTATNGEVISITDDAPPLVGTERVAIHLSRREGRPVALTGQYGAAEAWPVVYVGAPTLAALQAEIDKGVDGVEMTISTLAADDERGKDVSEQRESLTIKNVLELPTTGAPSKPS